MKQVELYTGSICITNKILKNCNKEKIIWFREKKKKTINKQKQQTHPK